MYKASILFVTDNSATVRAWLDWALASLWRIADPSEVRVFVAAPEDEGWADCTWIDAKPYLDEFRLGRPTPARFNGRPPPPMTFFRLFAPFVPEFRDMDRLIYCDSDFEFLSRRFLDLGKLEFAEDVAACLDCEATREGECRDLPAAAGLPGFGLAFRDCDRDRLAGGVYYNAGLLAFNLRAVRARRPGYRQELSKMLDFCLGSGALRLADQSVANLLGFSWRTLPGEYNAIARRYSGGVPFAIHYACADKHTSRVYPPPESRARMFPSSECLGPGGRAAPVDVVYVVGRGAKDIGDRPLRWSLRSLARHAANVGRVIVAGEPPAWLSDRAVALPIPDEPGFCKQTNIALCAIKAARAAGIDGPFLYSSDDHYFLPNSADPGLLRPGQTGDSPAGKHDLRRWPRYFTGDLPTRGATDYECSLAATRRFLRARGLPSSRRACAHIDTWMDGRDLDEAERLVREGARSSRLGLEPTCVFNALFEARGGGASGAYVRYTHDLKVRTAADCQFKLDHARPQFSTSPASERDPGVIAWMDEHFPEPSPWERT